MDFINLEIAEVGSIVAEPATIMFLGVPAVMIIIVISILWNR